MKKIKKGSCGRAHAPPHLHPTPSSYDPAVLADKGVNNSQLNCAKMLFRKLSYYKT